MNLSGQTDPRRQFGGIAFVVLLHVGIVYALANGLGHKVVEVLRQPLQTSVIKETAPPPEAKKLPPPKLAPPPPPYIPPPEVRIQPSAAPVQNAISAVTNTKPAEPPPAPVAKEPVHVAPVLDRASFREPEYPPTSRRLEETGTVLLELVVETDGAVSEVKVVQSSGFNRLDEAARAAAARFRFAPGTADGKPERSVTRYKYTFKLN